MNAWPYIPGVPAAGHVTSGGGWHPGQISGCPKCPPAPCPVLYSPSSEIIGTASTEQGAIRCAAGISRLPCERMTATRQRRLDGTWAWFAGPVLIQGSRR